MTTYTVELSEAEQKAMEYVAVDVNDWIQNAVHDRARIAMDEMVAVHVTAELNAGNAVSGTKEELVMASELPSAQARNEALIQETKMYGDPEVDPPKTPVPPAPTPPEPEPDEDDEDDTATEEEADEPKT